MKARIPFAVVASALLLSATIVPASAHKPVPYQSSPGQYPAGSLLDANWGTPAPHASLKPGIQLAMGDITSSRESKAPRISLSGDDADGYIYYQDPADSPCTEAQLACAARKVGGTETWRVTISEEGSGSGNFVDWCALPAGSGTCWDVRRVTLHEFGHILRLDHATEALENTAPDRSIMQSSTPTSGNAGGVEHDFQNCDRARLQYLYGVQSTVTLAGCHHEAAWATGGGVPTQVGIQSNGSNADFNVCLGDTVVFTGSFRTQNITEEPANMNNLANNVLEGRSVQLMRRDTGVGSFVAYGSSVVTDEDGVWQKTVDFFAPHDFEWRARFDDTVGAKTTSLNSDNSSTMRVRWLDC